MRTAPTYFKMPDGSLRPVDINALAETGCISSLVPLSIGHTIAFDDTVYEIIGLRHQVPYGTTESAIIVTLDTVGRKTLAPPAPDQ